MKRPLMAALAFLLTVAPVVAAPARQRAAGTQGQQNEELKAARDQLNRDMAEAKRLQAQLKADRQARNRDMVKRDDDALKSIREKIKQDQARIKQLTSDRGRAGGGNGRRGGRGRGR